MSFLLRFLYCPINFYFQYEKRTNDESKDSSLFHSCDDQLENGPTVPAHDEDLISLPPPLDIPPRSLTGLNRNSNNSKFNQTRALFSKDTSGRRHPERELGFSPPSQGFSNNLKLYFADIAS